MVSYTFQHSLDKTWFFKKLGWWPSASGDIGAVALFFSHSLCVSFLSSVWVLAVPLSMSLITPHFYSRGQNLQFLLPLEDSVGKAKTLNKLSGGGGGKFTCDFNEDGKQCFFSDFTWLAIILRKQTFLLFSYWIFFSQKPATKRMHLGAVLLRPYPHKLCFILSFKNVFCHIS